jgi:hypothetical protein
VDPEGCCTLCSLGTYGPACASFCPNSTASVACSGHGHCQMLGTGIGGCLCDPPWKGPGCDASCICSGHGACALAGDGCSCFSNGILGHWAGVSCSRCAVGWSGLDCTKPCAGDCAVRCSAHGALIGSGCVCDAGWAARNCSVECAGGAALPCAGHGSCYDGFLGDGSCQCQEGFAGADCGTPCPGPPGDCCWGHGVCSSVDGSCVCFRDPVRGAWAGAACDRCADGFTGAWCLVRCADGDGGVTCSGHGSCDLDVGGCLCDSSVIRGFWSGRWCTDCLPGYFGPDCTAACPGTCAVCEGHGACSGGRNGTGVCTCIASEMAGFWGGADCATCRAGYIGPRCLARCPQSPDGYECAGHGLCILVTDTVAGCVCVNDRARSRWAGPSCELCTAGFTGPNCSVQLCLEACVGLDRCDVSCTFDTDTIGWKYETLCPVVGGALCNGHGQCLTVFDQSTCACDRGWDGMDCFECAAGWGGHSCAEQCYGGALAPCSGAGICDDGLGGSLSCVCDVLHTGADCSLRCPVHDGFVCGGHGTCTDNGTCACFLTPSPGLWAGLTCTECAEGYTGVMCG